MKNHDTIQRFLFEDHNVRGAIVHLNKSFSTIMNQYNYPDAIQQLLGETLLASIMLSDRVKHKGQVTIQLQSRGPITLLVAKCTHQHHIRGLAKWDESIQPDVLKAAMGQGELVITVERDDVVQPYQSIVPLHGERVSSALTYYFEQSEQLPSQFLMTISNDQAAGMMLQMMPEKVSDSQKHSWFELAEHFSDIKPNDLLHFQNPDLLTQYFKQENIRLFDTKPIEFRCRCDLPRMQNVIHTLGKTEAMDILEKKHRLVVTCDYCKNEYAFSREEVEAIFTD